MEEEKEVSQNKGVNVMAPGAGFEPARAIAHRLSRPAP